MGKGWDFSNVRLVRSSYFPAGRIVKSGGVSFDPSGKGKKCIGTFHPRSRSEHGESSSSSLFVDNPSFRCEKTLRPLSPFSAFPHPSFDFPIYEKSPGILTVFLSYLAFFYFIYLAFISILTLSTYLFDNAHAYCIMCYSSSLRSHLHLGTKRSYKKKGMGGNVKIGTGDRTKTFRC